MSRWDNKCFMLYRVYSFIKNIVSLNFTHHKWSYLSFLKYVAAKLNGRVQRIPFFRCNVPCICDNKMCEDKERLHFNYRSATPAKKKDLPCRHWFSYQWSKACLHLKGLSLERKSRFQVTGNKIHCTRIHCMEIHYPKTQTFIVNSQHDSWQLLTSELK